MKNIFVGLMAAVVLAGSLKAVDLATVNYDLLYVNSKEGKALELKKERAVADYRKLAMNEQQKISLKEQQLAQKMYGADAADEAGTMQEAVSLEKDKLNAQSKVRSAEFDIKLLESEEKSLRTKLDAVVDEFRKDKNLPIIIASNYPGVKASPELDRTDDVLKLADKKYDAALAKASILTKKEIKQA